MLGDGVVFEFAHHSRPLDGLNRRASCDPRLLLELLFELLDRFLERGDLGLQCRNVTFRLAAEMLFTRLQHDFVGVVVRIEDRDRFEVFVADVAIGVKLPLWDDDDRSGTKVIGLIFDLGLAFPERTTTTSSTTVWL